MNSQIISIRFFILKNPPSRRIPLPSYRRLQFRPHSVCLQLMPSCLAPVIILPFSITLWRTLILYIYRSAFLSIKINLSIVQKRPLLRFYKAYSLLWLFITKNLCHHVMLRAVALRFSSNYTKKIDWKMIILVSVWLRAVSKWHIKYLSMVLYRSLLQLNINSEKISFKK